MTEGPTERAMRRLLPSIRTRMVARDSDEAHRVSSPLELLFDLTFVVAIAQVAAQLAHTIAEGHAGEGILPYLMVFFAIWWAWMNFTWFASAYDTDDVPYRLLTFLQMGGVLLLASGVKDAFDHSNFLGITIGYLVMRVALAAQWLRAGIEDPNSRTTAFRYAAGIALVQLGWVLRLLLPTEEWVVIAGFAVLAVLELAVPPWAERSGSTAWHPHHIAERYGLFTIIVLGESVAAATAGVTSAASSGGISVELVAVSIGALILLVSLWWLYFLEPAGEGLSVQRSWSYFWGYGHYFVFASLAAVGAGLETAVDLGRHSGSGLVVGYALAVPVAAFVVLMTVLHAPLVEKLVIPPQASIAAAVIVLLLPLAAGGLGVPFVVISIALVVALLVTFTIVVSANKEQHP